MASTNVLISRNRRPSRPILAKSSSASLCNRSRASSAMRVVLLRLGAKVGPGGAEGPRGDPAVDEGEYVGFESAMPIWCRRREKSPVGKSGSIASARTAISTCQRVLTARGEFDHSPSSLTLFSRAFGCGFGASALGWRATASGTAAPGARAGNFRAAPLATLDDEEPIANTNMKR
jgi:hypothetical protein